MKKLLNFIRRFWHAFWAALRATDEVPAGNPGNAHENLGSVHPRQQERTIQRDARNPEYLMLACESLKRYEAFNLNFYSGLLANPVLEPYEHLRDYAEQAKDKPFLEVYLHTISFVKLADIRTAIEQRCGQAMDDILRIYSAEILEATFNAIPAAASIKSRYDLTPDVRTHESTKGQMALKQNLGHIYSELAEIGRLQEKLMNYFPRLQSILESAGFNWGSAAEYFARGALVSVNPVLGIAAIIQILHRDSKAKKETEAFLSIVMADFREYLDRWDRLWELYLSVLKQQRSFIEGMLKGIFEVTMPTVMKAIDEAGFSLENVPSAYTVILKQIE